MHRVNYSIDIFQFLTRDVLLEILSITGHREDEELL